MQSGFEESGPMPEADVNLIEQVLIDLVVNSIDGVQGVADAKIVLSVYFGTNNKSVIIVGDNGTGIAEETMAEMFILFSTTKKSGSGIGLSLCKQITMLHRATCRYILFRVQDFLYFAFLKITVHCTINKIIFFL